MTSSLSLCFLRPILQQKGGAGKPGVSDAVRQEVGRLSDPASLVLYEQQTKIDDNRSLLEMVICYSRATFK